MRNEGEDCLSAASSAAPEGGASLRARLPDNSGGASWFVLLAVEKNEYSESPRTPMRGPERVGGRFIYVVSCRNSWIPCRSAE